MVSAHDPSLAWQNKESTQRAFPENPGRCSDQPTTPSLGTVMKWCAHPSKFSFCHLTSKEASGVTTPPLQAGPFHDIPGDQTALETLNSRDRSSASTSVSHCVLPPPPASNMHTALCQTCLLSTACQVPSHGKATNKEACVSRRTAPAGGDRPGWEGEKRAATACSRRQTRSLP